MDRTSCCPWALTPDLTDYHDTEWGVPVLGDIKQFEFLTLEGAQAGLSWLTILRKRAGYRRAFADFEPCKVAAFGAADIERLMNCAEIIRNRKKIESTISNAAAFIRVQEEHGSFCKYIWGFVDGRVLNGRRRHSGDIPPSSALSEKLAKDMKSRGFKFLGPVVIYSHLQAAGLINDHIESCFRHRELGEMAARLGLA